MSFTGIPVAALDFYDDLEVDNSRTFFEAHRTTYDESVRAPIVALCAELEAEFCQEGQSAKVFRPYRDVRFSKDKTPFKTHQGAFVAAAPSCGFYVQVGAPGVRVGGGFYHAEPANLARIRDGIDTDGASLEAVLAELEAAGFERSGERLKTSPRGWDADHPRIDLLRHKSLAMGRLYGFEPIIHTPELLDMVRQDWRRLRPLIDWIVPRLEVIG